MSRKGWWAEFNFWTLRFVTTFKTAFEVSKITSKQLQNKHRENSFSPKSVIEKLCIRNQILFRLSFLDAQLSLNSNSIIHLSSRHFNVLEKFPLINRCYRTGHLFSTNTTPRRLQSVGAWSAQCRQLVLKSKIIHWPALVIWFFTIYEIFQGRT